MSRRLIKEYAHIKEYPDERFDITGTYHKTQGNNIVWDCDLFIESITSAYRDSVIHITLMFPLSYPFKPPKVIFTTPLYHRYIHKQQRRHATLCKKLLPQLWWQSNEAGTPYAFTKNTVRFCIDILYNMIASEGENIDSMINVCRDVDIEHTRQTSYMLYDKIIQRCLGQELPEDTFEDKTWSNMNTWRFEKNKQIQLDNIQLNLLTQIFDNQYAELQAITQKFLGIEDGGVQKKNIFTSTYVFDPVEKPTGTVELLCSDGKHLHVPQWSIIELWNNMDLNDVIPMPFDSVMMTKVMNMCRVSEQKVIRKYNPTNITMEPILTDPVEDIMDIIRATTFMGAYKLTMLCCLSLSLQIKRQSRKTRAMQNVSDLPAMFRLMTTRKMRI